MLMRLFVSLAVVLFWLRPAAAIVNPHYDDNSCGSCHLRTPTPGPGGAMDYRFLGEEIDRTCMICHEQACCTIAGPHQSTHASGIDRWDRQKFGYPKTLPLSDGHITCATCHFWRRNINPAPQDYKLVRLVDIRSTGVEWTRLCQDCHAKQ